MRASVATVWLLLLSCGSAAWATCTQQLDYRGEGVALEIVENFGSYRPLLELLAEAEAALPMLHGWEGEIDPTAPRHGFYLACGQHNNASYWRGEELMLERACEPGGVAGTLAAMLQGLGWAGRREGQMAGYTIQVAYLPQGDGWGDEWGRWDDHLFQHAAEGSPEAIRVSGDCVQQSLWAHHYPNGGMGLRFGIYRHYRDALRAIRELELPANHAQILPQRFALGGLRDYIQH